MTTNLFSEEKQMIIISGTIPIQPDKREAAYAAALEMADATQKEAGCITYDFYSSVRDPNMILVYEEWETDAALTAHFATPHMAVFRSKLPDLVAGEGVIKKFVAESAGIV
jgi:quinol monooxygenase YgiN